MELPPLVQRIIADTSAYRKGLKDASDLLRSFGSTTNQGMNAAAANYNQITRKVADIADRLGGGGISQSRLQHLDQLNEKIKNIKKVTDDPILHKRLNDLLNAQPGGASGRDVAKFAKQVLDDRSIWDRTKSMFAEGGTFGGLGVKVASGYSILHGFTEMVNGVKRGAEQFFGGITKGLGEIGKGIMEGSKTIANSAVDGLSKALGGLFEGLGDFFHESMTGNVFGGLVKGLSKIVSGVIDGLGSALTGAISGTAAGISGAITGISSMIAGAIKGLGSSLGGIIGGGGAIAAGAMALTGVGIPAALITYAAAKIVASIIEAVSSGLGSLVGGIGSFIGQAVGAVADVLGKTVGMLAEGLGKAFSVGGEMASEFLGAITSAGMEAEKLIMTFGVLTGSAETGRKIFADIQAMTIISPYTISQLSDAAQTLMSMGVHASELNQTLNVLGDVAVGDASRLKRLAIVYGEVKAEGKITGWRIRQLASLGVGIEDMAETLGIRPEHFRERLTMGLVPGDVLRRTLNKLSGPGGRMEDMMSKNLETTAGQWQRLQGIVETTLAGMGLAFLKSSGLMQTFRGVADWVTSTMPGLKNFADRLGATFATIGAEMKNIAAAVAQFMGINLGSMLVGSGSFLDPKTMEAVVDKAIDIMEDIALGGADVVDFFVDLVIAGSELVRWVRNMANRVMNVADLISIIFTPANVIKILNVSLPKDAADVVANTMTPAGVRLVDWLTDPGDVGPQTPDWALGMLKDRGWRQADIKALFHGGRLDLAAARLQAAQAAPHPSDFVGPMKELVGPVKPGHVDIPKTLGEWEADASSTLAGMRKLIGSGSLSDHLTGANLRGSQEAYETFAKSWADKMGPQSVEDILREGLALDEERNRVQALELEAMKSLPQDLKDKLGWGPIPAMGINGPQ